MSRQAVTIQTRDGRCPASVFRPADTEGRLPAIVFFMDGLAIRPTLWEMGQRLADTGYLVLMPDLFYRSGAYPPMDPASVFSDPAQRAELMKLVGTLDRDAKISDVGAFVDYLSTRGDIAGDRYGVTGYCLGGNVALTAGYAYPKRVAAIASFHGGNLAADAPDSPHRFVASIEGPVYVAAAIEDTSFPVEQKERLERALTEAEVDHVIETYDARHGFAVPDLPTYDRAAADRHWAAMAQLFAATLPR